MKLKSILFGLLSGLVIIVIVPYLLTSLNDNLNFPVYDNIIINLIGIILFILGLFIFIYCSSLFSKLGKGTPAPVEPPKKLVASGLYRFTRNPIYIGYFFIFFAEFLIFGRLLLLFYLAFMIIAIHLYVVYYEEPILKKRFGEEYINYTKKVPRWI